MATMQLRTVNEIENDNDVVDALKNNKRVCNTLAAHFAAFAGELGGALAVYDRQAGRRRRAKVTRRLAVAAGLQVLAARAMVAADRAFRTEYEPEISAARGRGPRRPRTSRVRFGD